MSLFYLQSPEQVNPSKSNKIRKSSFFVCAAIFSLSFSGNEVAIAENKDQDPTKPAPELIQIKVKEIQGSSEWIRIEAKGSQLQFLHTRNAISDVSKYIWPPLIPKIYTWDDHPVSKVVFYPKACLDSKPQTSFKFTSCSILQIGNSINLPSEINPYEGRFTIEYSEDSFVRTISFELPVPVKENISRLPEESK